MKKVFAVVMAALMAVSVFSGCQNGNARGDAIRIGLTGPLTGDAAVYGKAVQWGMEVAVEEINAKGGLQFEFKAEDDVCDNEKAGNAYAALKDWNMQIFAGAVTTGPCNTIAPLTVQDNMFMMTPSGSGEDIVKGRSNVFQMCFTDPNQGAASAELIKGQNLGTKVGILYDSSTDYSNGIKKSFEAKAKDLGLEVSVVTSFDNNNNTDMKTQLQQCKDAGCDLVFLPIYAAQAATILGNAKDMDYAPTFLGCDGMDGILSVENFDKSLAEGLIMMTPFAADADDAATKSFVEKYKAKSGGEIPNQFAADGYDVIYAIYEACVKEGITGKTSNADTCAKLMAYFKTATFNGLTGTNMTWDAEGMVSKMPTAVVVENGAYVKK
jgi:branched-chain amino acid transport system substrate-binding protein